MLKNVPQWAGFRTTFSRLPEPLTGHISRKTYKNKSQQNCCPCGPKQSIDVWVPNPITLKAWLAFLFLAEKTDSPSVPNNKTVPPKETIPFLGDLLLFRVKTIPWADSLHCRSWFQSYFTKPAGRKKKTKPEKVVHAIFHIVRNIFTWRGQKAGHLERPLLASGRIERLLSLAAETVIGQTWRFNASEAAPSTRVWRSRLRWSRRPRLPPEAPASVSRCSDANYGVRKINLFFPKDINQTYQVSTKKKKTLQLGIAMKDSRGKKGFAYY